MEPETYERALHQWPLWWQSIVQSRADLGYNPEWRVERAVEWINANYGVIRPKGIAELKRLRLPPNLLEYWEDCLYCDYRGEDDEFDFDKIRRCIAYEEVDRSGKKTGFWKPGNRSLPKLPYEGSIVIYGDEDVHDPWVRIEIRIHRSLATRVMVDAAAEQGWRTFNYSSRFSPGDEPHPLLEYVPKAGANQSERKKAALERYQAGEVTFEDLLVEEWRTSETQQELDDITRRFRNNPVRLKSTRRELDKKVYDRVRKWFPDPKPKVKSKSEWRKRLMPLELPASESGIPRPKGESRIATRDIEEIS